MGKKLIKIRAWILAKNLMEMKDRGEKVSPLVRNLIYEREGHIKEKYNINSLSYPIKNQEQQADPAKSPHRALSHAMFALKVPAETIKHALKKDSAILD